MDNDPKRVIWIASSREALRAFPEPVKDAVGYALYLAQIGGKDEAARPLLGFGGAGVVEVIKDFAGDTYRAVYTVRFAGAVYSLHAFQKKSKRGVATPKQEIDLVRGRLKQAEEHYRGWLKEKGHGKD